MQKQFQPRGLQTPPQKDNTQQNDASDVDENLTVELKAYFSSSASFALFAGWSNGKTVSLQYNRNDKIKQFLPQNRIVFATVIAKNRRVLYLAPCLLELLMVIVVGTINNFL